MTALLWGLGDDPQIRQLSEALGAIGEEHLVLDQRGHYDVDADADPDHPVVRSGARAVALDDVTGVFVRAWASGDVPELRSAPTDAPRVAREAADATLWSWLWRTGVLVMNRPEAAESNASKPWQATIIARHFAVPRTLVTTTPSAAADFLDQCGSVIVKSLSAHRSVVRHVRADELISRADDIGRCPVQLQEWVPGVDHRVHVVRGQALACEIVSDAVDYRYAESGAHLRAVELPPAVSTICAELCADLGLDFGGIDLRRTPDGRWVCFEVNPCPAFNYYEQATGSPVTAALAEALASR